MIGGLRTAVLAVMVSLGAVGGAGVSYAQSPAADQYAPTVVTEPLVFAPSAGCSAPIMSQQPTAAQEGAARRSADALARLTDAEGQLTTQQQAQVLGAEASAIQAHPDDVSWNLADAAQGWGAHAVAANPKDAAARELVSAAEDYQRSLDPGQHCDATRAHLQSVVSHAPRYIQSTLQDLEHQVEARFPDSKAAQTQAMADATRGYAEHLSREAPDDQSLSQFSTAAAQYQEALTATQFNPGSY